MSGADWAQSLTSSIATATNWSQATAKTWSQVFATAYAMASATAAQLELDLDDGTDAWSRYDRRAAGDPRTLYVEHGGA